MTLSLMLETDAITRRYNIILYAIGYLIGLLIVTSRVAAYLLSHQLDKVIALAQSAVSYIALQITPILLQPVMAAA